MAARRQADQAGQAGLGPAERAVIVTEAQNKLVDAEDEYDHDWVHEKSGGVCDFYDEVCTFAMLAVYRLEHIAGIMVSDGSAQNSATSGLRAQ